MTAVNLNYPEMVKLLLKYKDIKLDLKDKAGDSLMHLCIGSREEVSSSFIIMREYFWDEDGSEIVQLR